MAVSLITSKNIELNIESEKTCLNEKIGKFKVLKIVENRRIIFK